MSCHFYQMKTVKILLQDETPQCIKNKEIPDKLIKQLPEVIYAIGEQTMEFLIKIKSAFPLFHDKHPTINDFIENIIYSDVGLINKSKTIKAVYDSINEKYPDSMNDYKFLFIQACQYCSEADIILIWQKLTDEEKNEIENTDADISTNNFIITGFNRCKNSIVLYWGVHLNYFQSKDPLHRSSIDVARDIFFKYSNYMFSQKDIETFKFFFNLLYHQAEEKDNFFLNELIDIKSEFMSFPDNIDNWIFMMQQLSDEARIRYLKKVDIGTLIEYLFRSWPWRFLYIEIINLAIKHHDEIPRDIKYLSCWIVTQFWRTYQHNFFDGIIELFWKQPYDVSSKIQVITVLKIYYRFEEIKPDELRIQIIERMMRYRLYFCDTNQWDLFYQIYKYILEEEEDKYNYLAEIDMHTVCEYFIEKGGRYNIIDELLDAKNNNDEIQKAQFKLSINCPIIMGKIMANAKDNSDLKNKLNLFFKWFEFSKSERIQLLKCIPNTQLSRRDNNEWFKTYNCLEKTARPFIVAKKTSIT
ncbi:hypothetical protein HCN44_003058 [Aphidius gifuensis]|uniref:Uncharacterized protein n=1 Tax=Aphidius gifuensis TaxID=684658 RepID=A0A834XI15_APHGI|nr:hypothetical protein HCN44_003058 [Aphidius gifuensis]